LLGLAQQFLEVPLRGDVHQHNTFFALLPLKRPISEANFCKVLHNECAAMIFAAA
jgi:hypothetical protein